MQVSNREYEHLRRWLAVLQTDVDWNVERERHQQGCFKSLRELLPPVLTIAAMIATGVLFDGVLIILWAIFALVMGPIGVYLMIRGSNDLANERDPNPFASVEDRDSVMHFVDAEGVPSYDLQRHGISTATKLRRFLPRLPFLLLFGAFMCALWPLIFWHLWKGEDEDGLERVPLPATGAMQM